MAKIMLVAVEENFWKKLTYGHACAHMYTYLYIYLYLYLREREREGEEIRSGLLISLHWHLMRICHHLH